MSGNWIGGDVDEMRALGDTFAQQATLLRTGAGRLTASVAGIVWEGDDLELFVQDWQARHRPALLAAATLLEAQQAVLVANADDQARTSAQGGGIGAAGGLILPPGPGRPGTPVDPAALAADFRDALAGDPADLALWWGRLSEAEVDELIRQNPALVLGLQQLGLLDGTEYAAAYQAWLAQVQSDSVASGQSWSVHGGIAVPVYKIVSVDLAADLGVDLLEMGDGTYQVVVHGGGALGASVGDDDGLVGAGLDFGLGLDAAYRFDSREEAEAFMAALATAGAPDDLLDVVELGGGLVTLPVTNAPMSAYMAQEVAEVLMAHGDSLDSVTGASELGAGGSAVAASLAATGGAATTVNVQDGTATVTYEGSVTGTGALPVTGGASLSAAVTLDPSGQESTLQVSGDAQLLFGQSAGPIPNGAGVSGSITVDLTDPRNGAAAQQLVTAVAQGDAQAAQQAVAVLYESSGVVFQGDVLTGMSPEINLEVVSGGVGYQESDRAGLWVKPPGSSEYQQVG